MSPKTTTRPLQVEPLEDRTLPVVTRLVLDFNFDTSRRPLESGFDFRTFADAFTSANALGVTPRFLDFNRDGTVDLKDARIAADAILQRVRDYFAPFAGQGVSVEGVDLEGNTEAGSSLIREGRRSRSQQIFVLYLGGAVPDGRTLGKAPQAAVGFNNEGFGQVFTGAIANLFLAIGRGEGSPQRFADVVASSTAHELGHLLGLGHPVDLTQDRDSIMNSMRTRIGGDDAFINRSYLAFQFRQDGPAGRTRVLIRRQNPFVELVRSFRGQPHQTPQEFAQYSRDTLFAAGHVPHHGCDCPFCLTAASAVSVW